MNDDYVDTGGLLVPAHLAPTTLETDNMISLSVLQAVFNNLFYKRDDDPLDLLATLGSADPLLPKAKAIDFLKNPNTNTIHEIGPGNFHFARVFVDAVKPDLEHLIYYGHDFSDSSFVFAENELKPYQNTIRFNRTSIQEFPNKVKDDPLNLVLVEVLDDTPTEFFAMLDGHELRVHLKPQISSNVVIPSRLESGKKQALGGDFSKVTQRMLSGGSLKKRYSTKEIIDIIDAGKWGELKEIHPSFLKHLRYKKKHFLETPLEYIYESHWEHMPDSFKAYGDAMLSFYRGQLQRAEKLQTNEEFMLNPSFVSLPIAGLNLLWALKDREKVNIDFFDYGYDNVENRITPFSTYNGQISAPVNFEIMKYAAGYLRFNVQLENDSEFIRRNLGEDTIRLAYVRKAIKEYSKMKIKNLRRFMYVMLQQGVMELCPTANCTEKDILAFRLRRGDYEIFRTVGLEKGFIEKDTKVHEGSYHLAVYK